MIKEIGIGVVGRRWRESETGVLRMLLPLPLPLDSDPRMLEAGIDDFAPSDDAWNSDFDTLVREVVQSMDDGGAVEVVAPVRGARSVGDRLKRFFTFRRERHPLDSNPDRLEPDEALCSAARDASYLTLASVRTRQASVVTRDGQPMLWIWTGGDDTTWRRLEDRIARMKPTKALSLDFSRFGGPRRHERVPAIGRRPRDHGVDGRPSRRRAGPCQCCVAFARLDAVKRSCAPAAFRTAGAHARMR